MSYGGQGATSEPGSDEQEQEYQRREPEALNKAQAEPLDPDALPPGGYNAQEYKHLNVSEEIRELFKHIGR